MNQERSEVPKAREKFERTMKALFHAPKAEVKDEIKVRLDHENRTKG
jgi:hypothetical protein